jgi:hypothetical protein
MLETLTLQTAYQALMLTYPEVHTSVFLNLWLWAVHDTWIGNKKSRLRNTLLNTHTVTHTNFIRTAEDKRLSNKKQWICKSWFSSGSNDIDTKTRYYRVYHFQNKLHKHSCQPCNEGHTSFSLHYAQIMTEDSILIHKWALAL